MNEMEWHTTDAKPKDGQNVLIREYYRSAKSGRYRIGYSVFMYFEEYGFTLHEKTNSNLGMKVTHWMPIIDPKTPN